MRTASRAPLALTLLAVVLVLVSGAGAADPPPNVILFVPDGLRAAMVSMETAPALASLAREGVTFRNSHSVYPTLTMPNATALATGHFPGDTGVFGNSFLLPFSVERAGGTRVPQIENNAVLAELDERMGGSFVPQATLLSLARRAGYSTAVIGKHGPVLLQDHLARDGRSTIVIDDATGTPNGVPLAPDVAAAMAAAGLATATPPRGDNARAGNFQTPGTTTPNVVQQNWVADVATRVLLPLFKARGRPFVLVYWSRDPDASQHNQGDSFGRLQPGINGATSLAGIRNADDNLRRLREALVSLGLRDTTNIVVAADHGFSTVSRESATSPASKRRYADVVPGHLPPGFLSLDLAETLGLPLWDPGRKNQRVGPGEHSNGHGVLGADPADPDVVVAADGGVCADLPEGLASPQPRATRGGRADGARLRERHLRGRLPGLDCGHAADERHPSRRRSHHAAAVAGRQPAIVCHGLRGREQLQRDALQPGAAGSGASRQLRPIRDVQFHGGGGTELPSPGSWTRCRSAMPTCTRPSRGSCGCRANRAGR